MDMYLCVYVCAVVMFMRRAYRWAQARHLITFFAVLVAQDVEEQKRKAEEEKKRKKQEKEQEENELKKGRFLPVANLLSCFLTQRIHCVGIDFTQPNVVVYIIHISSPIFEFIFLHFSKCG